MAEYSLEPKDVMKIETQHRSIRTKIPVPESIPILEKLMRTEPRSMRGQPPIIWNEANDFIVSDHWGNRWIDWSSSVLIANAGHGRKEIKNALREMLDQGLLATYVFPHAKRAELTQMLQMLAPDPENYVVFLLTTGSEAVENCIKLSKTYAREKYGAYKRYIISFEKHFQN